MRITTTVGALRNALEAIKPVSEGRSVLPIVGKCLFRHTAIGILSVTATNLSMWLTAPVLGAVVVRDPSSDPTLSHGDETGFLLPFHILLNTVNHPDLCNEAVATLLRAEDACILTVGSFSVTFQSGYASEFPSIPMPSSEPMQRYTISLGAFLHGMNIVCPARGTDESRPTLTGVSLEVVQNEGAGQSLRFVATDTHRLAIHTTHRAFPLVQENAVAIIPGNRPATYKPIGVLPPETVTTIMGHCGGIEAGNVLILRIVADYGMVSFSIPSGNPLTVVTRLVEGQYPNYQQVVPTSQTWHLIVNRLALLRAVRLLEATAADDANRIRLTVVNDELVVSARDTANSAKETIPVRETMGEVSFMLNLRYLSDALRAFDTDMIQIAGEQQLKPLLFSEIDAETGRAVDSPPGLCYIVMPMKLDDQTDI